MILREAVDLDFANQLQWPLQKGLYLSASRKWLYFSILLPQCLLGMRCIVKRLTLDHMGSTGKERTPTSATKCYFPSLTLSNLVKNTMQSYVMVQGNEHQPSNL